MIGSFNKVLVAGVCSSLLLIQAGAKESNYSAEKIADIFYQLNGNPNDPHKKINHTKGFCAIGEFIPAKKITKTLDIPMLNQKNIPTQIRYSLGGGNPQASDKSNPKGLALKINGDSDNWELVLSNAEILFAKNPKEFSDFFSMRIPKNGKVDTKKIQKRTKEVDSFRNFEEYLNKMGVAASVANTMYYSVHTFFVKDAKTQQMLPARIKFVPTNGVAYLTQEELDKLGDDFLEDRFKEVKKPVEYKMQLVFANPEDSIDDVTSIWSGKHKELELGTLKISKYDGQGCNGDVYMPNVLPKGVGEPKDPLFDLRAATYATTFGRRQ